MQLKELVLATHNKGKVAEFEDLLKDFNVKLFCSDDFALAEPEETESTFVGNALLKARYTFEHTKKPSLSDDSGLCIPLLDGFPGVMSARFASSIGGFDAAMEELCRLVADKNNGNTVNVEAYFVCVLALIDHDGKEHTYEGRIHGILQWPPYGQGGFGYDPIFVSEGETKTFAELTKEEKGKISHRAKAVSLFMRSLNAC